MSRYLRQNRMKEMKAIRRQSDTSSKLSTSTQPKFNHNECPYCKSQRIEHSMKDSLCLDCHRHFLQ